MVNIHYSIFQCSENIHNLLETSSHVHFMFTLFHQVVHSTIMDSALISGEIELSRSLDTFQSVSIAKEMETS